MATRAGSARLLGQGIERVSVTAPRQYRLSHHLAATNQLCQRGLDLVLVYALPHSGREIFNRIIDFEAGPRLILMQSQTFHDGARYVTRRRGGCKKLFPRYGRGHMWADVLFNSQWRRFCKSTWRADRPHPTHATDPASYDNRVAYARTSPKRRAGMPYVTPRPGPQTPQLE